MFSSPSVGSRVALSLCYELLRQNCLLLLMRCSFKTRFLYYSSLKCVDRNPQLFSLDVARSDKHISRAAVKCFFFTLHPVAHKSRLSENGKSCLFVWSTGSTKPLPQFSNKYLILRVHIFLFQCCLTTVMQAMKQGFDKKGAGLRKCLLVQCSHSAVL